MLAIAAAQHKLNRPLQVGANLMGHLWSVDKTYLGSTADQNQLGEAPPARTTTEVQIFGPIEKMIMRMEKAW
jgi:hypothetical protein